VHGARITLPGGAAQRLFHACPKRGRVDCRVPVQSRRDGLEVVGEVIARDQASRQQLAHILDILRVPAFDLGERLRGRIEMMKGYEAFARDERAARLPVRTDRNEICRRGQLDVESQALLNSGIAR
jgi:hypothetical protein